MTRYRTMKKMYTGGQPWDDLPSTRRYPPVNTTMSGMYNPLLGNPNMGAPIGMMQAMNRGPNPQLAATSQQVPDTSGGINWGNVAGKVNDIAPFVSNIVNSFRKVPQPTMSQPDNYVTLQSPNYNDAKASAMRAINASDAGTDRIVDSTTAASIRQFNLGRKVETASGIDEMQANAKVDTANKQAMINSQIRSGNIAKRDEYNNMQLQRNIAQQRSQSENIANFSDKYVEIGNEKRKAQVEKDSASILASMYQQNGVMQRLAMKWKDAGLEDPLGRNYDYITIPSVKRMGGMVKLR